MTDSFVIRQAVEYDAEEISLIIKESMAHYRDESGIKGDVLESLTESKESVLERIRTKRCLCIFDCFEGEEKLVGTITIHKVNNPLKYSFSDKTMDFLSKYESCAYISRFAVATTVRKGGLGGRLIDYALTCPEVSETRLVILHTAVSNRQMKDFYFNRGFELLDSENSRGYERGLFYKKCEVNA